MEKTKMTKDELEKVSGGFPDGEFPNEENYCPLCGCMNLTLEKEEVIDDPSSAINRLLSDKTYRTYRCPMCKHGFVRYGDFYDFV